METCYLLLGSNTGNRSNYLLHAVEAICLFAGHVIQYSSIYETEPWGFEDTTPFLNQVIEVQTNLEADELMKKLLLAESELGRLRMNNAGGYISRPIDIDLLFYGQQIINKPGLIVPHPRLHQRRFTLVPLMEIAPGLIHPVLRRSIVELETTCPDTLKVVKFKSSN
jgi:2-amino-4-hydroxy-6-hydroxymethyldihydropteridine diphosphokinase